MTKPKTVRVTMMIPPDHYQELNRLAQSKGLPVPMFCRSALCELAEEEKKKAA